ncbi:hypothetical protein [Pseudonocardia lacus]|uniref:hypothetical protein n=1 Tax=Pseudonocardia lacus TaxID=2835865 RepID=UPI001BDC43E2|nr:hypothetical protein [Pseudonocardia lacus]
MPGTDRPTVRPANRPTPAPGAVALRVTLWVVLAIGLVGNAVVSVIGNGAVAPHALFGGMGALGLAGLVTLHLRSRR